MSKATTKKAKPALKKAGKAMSIKKVAAPKKVQPKKVVAKSVSKKLAKPVAAKKPLAKKAAVKKVAAKKAPVKNAVAKKAVVKKSVAKTVVKKVPVQKKSIVVAKEVAKKITGKAPQKKTSKALAPKEPLTIAPPLTSGDAPEKISSRHPSLMPRIEGKVARAIVPSSSTPINKEDKKTVSERALISQTTSQAPNILESDEGANPGFMQNDEVFDETDYAQHLQLMEQADVSRRARELNRPQTHPDFDGKHCVECEIVIPKLRLDAGRVRCVECQEEIENESKRLKNLERGRA